MTAETQPGTLSKDPEVRAFSLNTRLALGTAMLGIVTGPDPVDALLDMLTHTTLVADAMRNEARGKADSAVREVAGMPAQLSQERETALQDLFARFERERAVALRQMFAGIELERRGTPEQMALIIQRERSATLAEAAETLSTQRKAIIGDLTEMAARAEMRGREWGTALLLIGAVAVLALLIALFGMLLLYRRFLQRMERHPPR